MNLKFRIHWYDHRHTCRGVGVPRMADDSLAEPQNRDDID